MGAEVDYLGNILRVSVWLQYMYVCIYGTAVKYSCTLY
eukprot:COSAG01_NODE_66127_length_271_cov_0.604651_1_plen_37_part_10